MKRYILMGLLLVLLLMLHGCGIMEGSHTTVVDDTDAMLNQDTMVGMPAPFISYEDERGRTFPLSTTYGHATLIAIVDEEDQTSTSEITQLGKRLGADVTVVEICLGREDKTIEASAPLLKDIRGRNIISLSDRKGLIPAKFNNAAVNSVFLLDREGIIREQGRISQLQMFKRKINAMKELREKEYEDLYSGG